MSRRNRYHHAASSSASGSGISTPAPQILQPAAYHQQPHNYGNGLGFGGGVGGSSLSANGTGAGAGAASSSSSTTFSAGGTNPHRRSPSPYLQQPQQQAMTGGGGIPERYSESPFGGGRGGGAGVDRTAHQLEGQNNERLEGLLGKVKLLKDITVGIGDEVRQSNMELGDMNDTFSSTSAFLSGTFKRMRSMAKRQGGHWCWFMAFLGLVLWIFVVLWVIRR